MDKQALIAATQNSGGGPYALDDAGELWTKIDYVQQTKRYGSLISQLTKANDKNFRFYM